MPSSENFIEFHPACQSWKATASTACAYRSLSTSLISSLQFHNKELKNLCGICVCQAIQWSCHLWTHGMLQCMLPAKWLLCWKCRQSVLKLPILNLVAPMERNELVSTSACLVRPSWQAIWICRNGCKDQLQSSFVVHFDSASFCDNKEPDIDIIYIWYYIYMIYI